MPKVLLVEDDVTMVSLLQTLLKMENFQVVALDADGNVPEAVYAEQPDVLLLDVHLSRQDGLQILESLRRNEATKDVRVVMTSGLNLKDECLRHGANGFLLKPYMPDDLVEILKKTISA